MRNLTKIRKLSTLCFLGSALAIGNASAVAATCDQGSTSSETSLQEVFDGMTSGGSSSVNANTDCLADSVDSTWAVTASGSSVATMIIEIAGQATTNVFGVYDSSNHNSSVQLFDGAAGAGDRVVMSIMADGSIEINFADTGVDFAGNSFGYYLDIGNTRFFSDTGLNGDGLDHMLAYQGTGDLIQLPGLAAGSWTANEYVLAWEDLVGGGDGDYNDMVLMVESVQPVPVPAAVWLFGTGLLGLVGVARRRV